MAERILVTGGAGFVGSNLAIALKQEDSERQVVAFDNLRRRGSELAIPRLVAAGVSFVHGDIRNPDDLMEVGPVDVLVECSAEPSVHAGYGSSPSYVIDSNLKGIIHCLEFLRKHGGRLLFLSTSRVYPIADLCALPLEKRKNRFVLADAASGVGWSSHGISEQFTLAGHRSIYGATKLAAEFLITEYEHMYGIPAAVTRFSVIAGPWQMGKIDQGVFVLWLARHLFGGKLSYMGFGGLGLQVRDILHIEDVCDLIRLQVASPNTFSGQVFNAGGGPDNAISLQELTAIAMQVTGQKLDIGSDPDTRAGDIPYYITDNRVITAQTGWHPKRTVSTLADEVAQWLTDHRAALEPILSK